MEGESPRDFGKIRQKFNTPARPILPKDPDAAPASNNRRVDWITKDSNMSSHNALERVSSVRRIERPARERHQDDDQESEGARVQADEESAFVDEASGADLKTKLSVFEREIHGVTFKPIPGLSTISTGGSSPERTSSMTAAAAHSSLSPGFAPRTVSLSAHSSPPVRTLEGAELNKAPHPAIQEADDRGHSTAAASDAAGYVDSAAAADLKQKLSRFENKIKNSQAQAERSAPAGPRGGRTVTHTAGSHIPKAPGTRPNPPIHRSMTSAAGSFPRLDTQSSAELDPAPEVPLHVPVRASEAVSSASLAAIFKFNDPVILQKMLVQKEIELQAERVRRRQAEERLRSNTVPAQSTPLPLKSTEGRVVLKFYKWDEPSVKEMRSVLQRSALENQALQERNKDLESKMQEWEAARITAEALPKMPSFPAERV